METAWQSEEIRVFWRYISSTVEHLLQVPDGLDGECLHWRPPAQDSNSNATLVVHTLANAEENLLHVLCGHSPVTRGQHEFDGRGQSADNLQAQWRDTRERMERTLRELPAAVLECGVKHPRRGEITGREVLIVVARHTAEHLGHAELTRDLWLARSPA